MNWKQVFVAWALLLTGTCIVYLLASQYSNDLIFYFTAERRLVFINDVRSDIARVSDPTHPYSSYQAEIAVIATTEDQRRALYLIEAIEGSKQGVEARIAELERLRRTRTEFYLSDRAPHRFANRLVFPKVRLFAMLIPLLVLIFPSGLGLYFYYAAKRK